MLRVKCPGSVRQRWFRALKDVVSEIVSWAYERVKALPLYVKRDWKVTLKSKFEFWKIVDGYIKRQGSFSRLKVCKNGAKFFYSKTNAGVGSAT